MRACFRCPAENQLTACFLCCAADVAGGKGELAFELLNLNATPATVLEPRMLDLHKRAVWLAVSCLSRMQRVVLAAAAAVGEETY